MRLRQILAVVGLLYFVEGFPMGVFVDVVPVWLRSQGVDLESIGWLSLLGLAWSAKVLWSPLVDRYGDRRTWIAARPRWIPRRAGTPSSSIAARTSSTISS